MAIGVVGRKAGMTRIFTDEGNSIPVTVIQVDANRITEIKTPERDGYRAVQVTTGTRRANRITKPEAGHFAKNGVEAGRSLWEFRLEDQSEDGELQPGSELDVSQFEDGQSIDVTGQSKGKGFAGTVKRWNFSTQDKTHGNSLAHRAPGSIGQCQSPGRVFKGKKMSGQMGNARVTSQNIEIVRVDAERNLLLVKGPVPGANGGDLIIKPAVKA
ncbi:50S ribosomal protein L3 [Halovibrio salipaludis]|uniref:Large ribosomal subunit protein uL3 n=1 Tax=Halovibrio salipaludis TaxID=2032626 RepID=A0A2A2EVE2_9GAMM|nr:MULTISPECIES: 50S ribosomal protein L3 [Halomonadaceae]PAU76332.1 50S ribosomal protein L3 [Halovibrio salipaludis]